LHQVGVSHCFELLQIWPWLHALPQAPQLLVVSSAVQALPQHP